MRLYDFNGTSYFSKIECREPPTGIIVTWSNKVIDQYGGIRPFINHMNAWMSNEENVWLHKCKLCPTQDIHHVYIVIAGKIRYRFFYGGFKHADDDIPWSRLILAGPIVRAPCKLFIKGFQGFRYTNTIF